MKVYELFKKKTDPQTKKLILSELAKTGVKKEEIKEGSVRNYLKTNVYKDIARIKILAEHFTNGDVAKLFQLCNEVPKVVVPGNSELKNPKTNNEHVKETKKQPKKQERSEKKYLPSP